MRYRALSLACVLGMSTLLFAGCGNNNDNNGINARNANPGNWTRNAINPAANRNGAGNGNWLDRTRIAGLGGLGADGRDNNGADGVNGTDYANNRGNGILGLGLTGRSGSNGAGRSAGSGTTGNRGDNSTPSGGAYGVGDLSGQLRNLGVPSSDVLLLGNLMIVGVHPQGLNSGASVNGSNGSRGTNGSNGTGATGYNSSNGTNGSAAAPGSDTIASTDSSDQMLRTYFGRQYRVMKVSDRQALQAMERVRRNLYTASSIRSQSVQLVQDLHYIVSKATDVSSHPGTAGRSTAGTGVTGAGNTNTR